MSCFAGLFYCRDIAMEIIKNPNWKLAMRNCYHSKSEGLTTPLRELIKKMPGKNSLARCISSIFHRKCSYSVS